MPDNIPRLKKRGDKFYIYWTQHGKTKRLSLGTADPSEAKARYAAFLTSGAEITGAEKEVLTCGDALTRYRIEHVDCKNIDTVRQHVVIEHLFAHFADTPVRDVSHSHIETYCALRAAGTIGRVSRPATHRRELAILQAALSHARRKKRLDAGDMPLIELPPASPPKDRWLTKDELRSLVGQAVVYMAAGGGMSRLHRFVVLAYYTASRRNAVERLTWFQVDMAHKRINLAQPGERQTTKRRSVVPITPALMPLLKQAYKERVNEYVLGTPAPIWWGFKQCAKLAKLENVTPHTLRHTRAVHLAQQGVPVYEIAGLLGDTVATVASVYLHHSPDHLSAIVGADQENQAL